MSEEKAFKVGLGAGLTAQEVKDLYRLARERLLSRL